MALWTLALLPCARAFSLADLIKPLSTNDYVVYSLVSIALVLCAGVMSGLTVGMMSLDELELEMKLAIGDENEKAQATRLLPVIKKHHLLLVTLLLANAASMEALPIFLDKMFPAEMAVAMSVSFVLVFGEVIPQAMFIGPSQLKITSALVPMVKLVMLCLFPLSYPIAKALDKMLGPETSESHIVEETNKKEESSDIDPKQIKLIHGAMAIKKEIVSGHMIPIEKVFSISISTVLNRSVLDEIISKGYSRVPVYRNDNSTMLVGILLVKRLIGVEPSETMTLEESGIELRPPIITGPTQSLSTLLSKFEEGRSHMAFVSEFVRDRQPEDLATLLQKGDEVNPQCSIKGIITLEDVLEQLLKISIEDEDDLDEKVVSQLPKKDKKHVKKPSKDSF